MRNNIKKSAIVAIPILALTAFAIGSAQAATDISAGAATSTSSNNTRFNANRPQLTDAQKQTLQQVRELYHQGKTSEAEALAKQAGLPERPQAGEREGRGAGLTGHSEHHKPEENLTAEEKLAREAKRQALENAIAANDYATFVSLIAGTPFEGKITESTFPKLVEAQALMKAGDHKGAHTIMKELDIHGPFLRGKLKASSTPSSI